MNGDDFFTECPFCNSVYLVPNGETAQGHEVTHCMSCMGDFESISGDPVCEEDYDLDSPIPYRLVEDFEESGDSGVL